jgi:hypothetical protein
MKLSISTILSLLLVSISCQTLLDVNLCVGLITAAPNCDYYGSKIAQCNQLVGSQLADCYCQQKFFNAIAGYALGFLFHAK